MASCGVLESRTELLKRGDEPACVTDGRDQKRLKAGENEKVDEEEYEHGSSDEDDYANAAHRRAVRKYKKQFEESDGFEFDQYVPPSTPGYCWVPSVVLDVEDQKHRSPTFFCKKAVAFAIRKENEKRIQKGEPLLEFVRLTRANKVYPNWFFATFEARTVPDGTHQLYQSQIYYRSWYFYETNGHNEGLENARVEVFRPKPGF
ncbi:unnamed protein product [Cuscuta epithymum]|uniref:Uncharacterized protein n=1 Tax=Cuscuta epithymum TaxID=186058 RepID=A0AAV0C5Z4_9ASTE|nr:unnamed protein product [Cuscuta epithymum]